MARLASRVTRRQCLISSQVRAIIESDAFRLASSRIALHCCAQIAPSPPTRGLDLLFCPRLASTCLRFFRFLLFAHRLSTSLGARSLYTSMLSRLCSPRSLTSNLFLRFSCSEKSKRRTKTIASTNDPKWHQTFVYSPLRRSDLKARALEIALWDYDRFGCSEFLGEVLVELATAPLDDEAEWYLLGTHEETVTQLVSLTNFRAARSVLGRAPPARLLTTCENAN